MNLLDVLVRIAEEEPGDEHEPPDTEIVYTDTVPSVLLRAFESLVLACAESRQQQNYAELLHGRARVLRRLPGTWRHEFAGAIVSTLSTLANYPPTRTLQHALHATAQPLRHAGQEQAGDALVAAAREARSAA